MVNALCSARKKKKEVVYALHVNCCYIRCHLHGRAARRRFWWSLRRLWNIGFVFLLVSCLHLIACLWRTALMTKVREQKCILFNAFCTGEAIVKSLGRRDCCSAYLTLMTLHRVGDATPKRNDQFIRKDHQNWDEFDFKRNQSDLLRFCTINCPRPEIGNRFDRGHSTQANFDTYVYKIDLFFARWLCAFVSCARAHERV